MAHEVVPFIIDGRDVFAEETFEVKSPATGQVLHRCGIATTVSANAAVAAAATAWDDWRLTTPTRRRDILLATAEGFQKRREELRRDMMDEVAAPAEWADFNIDTSIEMLKGVAGQVSSIQANGPALSEAGSTGLVLMEPYGVVVAIAPWNAPYILGLRSVLFPIAAGCTVVLKGSENAPRVFYNIVKILHEAGLPNGVLNFISTTPSYAQAVTEALIAHPDVRKLNFTGSTNVGKVIGRLAGEHLKPTVMELGGKGAAIVWKDAELQLAVEQCAIGAFLFSGQICMSTEKILVHKDVSQEFQAKFAEHVKTQYPSAGQGLFLINAQAVTKNKALLRDAVDKGATLLHGDLESPEGSAQMHPAVVSGVSSSMDIYRTESFGPSVSILEFSDEREAILLANDTEYGLNSAVFSQDLGLSLRIAKALRAGAVHINSMTVHDENALPHGGSKSSGWGRFNGTDGLHEWVQTKSITWKNS